MVIELTQARTGRRKFLTGLIAAGLVPKPTWADVGSPVFLTAGARADGSYVLCGVDEALKIRFAISLPDRGHAAAGHPTRPEAVAFARRPGTFAIVIDCLTGVQKAVLSAPSGRHFYGHGVFSSDGNLLFTTENDFEAGQGCIGVWDRGAGYIRVDEWASGGIGPHDIKRLPDTETLVVANGGIETHPDTGRTKLNIPTMKPNLSYVEDGTVVEVAELSSSMHKNSIRHLAIGAGGQVAFGMQWQGDGPVSALVGVHNRSAPISLMSASESEVRRMDGYVGSISFSEDGRTIAATSPRGGIVHLYHAESGALRETVEVRDVSGVAPIDGSFAVTSGEGVFAKISDKDRLTQRLANFAWDNHLVRL